MNTIRNNRIPFTNTEESAASSMAYRMIRKHGFFAARYHCTTMLVWLKNWNDKSIASAKNFEWWILVREKIMLMESAVSTNEIKPRAGNNAQKEDY